MTTNRAVILGIDCEALVGTSWCRAIERHIVFIARIHTEIAGRVDRTQVRLYAQP